MNNIFNISPRKGVDNSGRRMSGYQSGIWYIGSAFFFDFKNRELNIVFEPPTRTRQWFYENEFHNQN